MRGAMAPATSAKPKVKKSHSAQAMQMVNLSKAHSSAPKIPKANSLRKINCSSASTSYAPRRAMPIIRHAITARLPPSAKRMTTAKTLQNPFALTARASPTIPQSPQPPSAKRITTAKTKQNQSVSMVRVQIHVITIHLPKYASDRRVITATRGNRRYSNVQAQDSSVKKSKMKTTSIATTQRLPAHKSVQPILCAKKSKATF